MCVLIVTLHIFPDAILSASPDLHPPQQDCREQNSQSPYEGSPAGKTDLPRTGRENNADPPQKRQNKVI